MKKITIIGATGTLGLPITKQLTKKGVQVKAVVRDIKKAKEILPSTVEIVYGDVAEKDSLKTALTGSETIYLNLNTTNWDENASFQPEREGIMNVIDISKELGINHIMQIVGIDSSHPEFAVKGMEYKTNRIRKPGMEYLKNSGINYTYFHCSVFLDSFPTFIQGEDFGIIGHHQYPVFFTNTTDLADTIYNAIGNDKVYNRAFTVQGQEGLSFPEAAQRFVNIYNPSIQISEYPMETIKHIGLPSKEYEDFMEHMLTYVEQLKEEQVSQPTWDLLGKPKLTIEEFTKSLI
ncbi:SDR family oxidoreductase [Flammeovirga agarivorans]|uniref:NAD(P)H-binding protein n=1 Tax=Flammeovirga agarivorans TaxID=2726742 RepID=A0A7X8XY68_9BACT|nr:NAD(P)H-binding protein [Flammeovirga agarivorans]NLR93770.1 NAD(P)H-binding protein [Flammeovirga agarivorans]